MRTVTDAAGRNEMFWPLQEASSDEAWFYRAEVIKDNFSMQLLHVARPVQQAFLGPPV